MSKMSWQPLVLTAATLAIAVTAQAAGVNGTLDGDAREWHVVTHSEGSTANFSEIAPGMFSITIQAHREPRYALEGTLSIDFMVMNGQPMDASVMYLPESSMMPHYGTEGETANIQFETLEIEGDTARLKGNVETTLLYLASISEGHDPDDTLDVAVEFDVEAIRAD
ncbi:hypothetical protein [Halomonas urumqiensis]|uniref:YceI family protein n=1 Tax=Halomonas urumqiensis TaxID=1684789 RepID=A0A2N7UFD6_9GAMM|nr:hypothetical protein [Halomonas urumqiensis]PMR79147.1 hypothetical protein C1H70_12645 [Halomonas urumqiensis]PTB03822.1 hypothetical protein C6V82_04930 [Halomonas urumqiensis]GHE19945.1 hypothetical protein GCM10017767_04660 [Halomonas urumqiensis]